jgi:hypothetical protein
MTALLGTVTVLSLALAAGLSVIVWRLLQAERERSEARVEALRQMADAERLQHADAAHFADTPIDRMSEPSSIALRDDLPTGPADLFTEPPGQPAWAKRAAFAAIAGVVLVGGVTLLRPSAAVTESASPASSSGAAAAGTPLDLLSLHHDQQGETLTISGLVQNPRGGRPLEGVVATAQLVGADGSIVGSGRSALDYTRLAPGDESPFVVTMPAAQGVARYRIGFRTTDGRVVGHVDRRARSTPVARVQE